MTRFSLILLLMCLAVPNLAEVSSRDQAGAFSILDQRVPVFVATDTSIVDALSKLSFLKIDGLHLGIQEILRENIADPVDRNTLFSVRLENATVGEILDALCSSDARYVWVVDGETIDVYPRESAEDISNFLNLRIEKISFANIPDPEQALTSLARQLPTQQIGYMQLGLGDSRYGSPWTQTFEHLTVRQFANRIAEHMGPRSVWIWQGGENERMFTFLMGGFHRG